MLDTKLNDSLLTAYIQEKFMESLEGDLILRQFAGPIPPRKRKMKKRDLYNHIKALDDRLDKQNRDIGSLETRLSQMAQTINALSDKLAAAEANEVLAADLADLDAAEALDAPPVDGWFYGGSPATVGVTPPVDGWFGPSTKHYGKSPAEIAVVAPEEMKVKLAYPGAPLADHIKGIYLDDILGETFPYTSPPPPSRLTASEVVAAAQALDAEPNPLDVWCARVAKSMAKRLDTEVMAVFEPTDEDLAQIDQLVNELISEKE